MHSPTVIAEALTRAEVNRLPPAARAYLSERMLSRDSGAPNNIGGVRNMSFGSNGGPAYASFVDIDAGARALVAISYRAAPRDWRSVTSDEVATLSTYPLSGVLDIAKSAGATILGPVAAVAERIQSVTGPTEELQATFRGLVADWEAYERLGVGDSILKNMRDDLVEWRAFRDAWLDGSIPYPRRS